MIARTSSISSLARGFAALVGFAFLIGCGSGSSPTTTTGTPSITLSPTSLTFSGEFVGSTSAAQPVTVSNPGTAGLSISGITPSGDFGQTNTCGTGIAAGGSCTISVTFTPTATGTRTGAITITDNASGSPHSIGLTGTGTSINVSPASLTFSDVPVGSPSTAQPVTLSNTSNSALAISSVAITAGSSYFSQTNTCGSSVAAAGSCKINVVFTPSSTGTVNGTLTITDNADGVAGSTQTVSLTGTSSGSNTVPVTVNFGPGGFTTTSNSYYNGIFTTVTVCEPGTTTCTDVPNVLVDTGSTGLRVLSSALNGISLPQVNDGSGDNLYECYEFGSLSYTWGPVSMASVQIGGETATQVPAGSGGTTNSGIPIQAITANATAPAGAPCLANSTGAMNSLASLGANGLLGIGTLQQDCGVACTSASTSVNVNPFPYILCTGSGTSSCGLPTVVPLAAQPWNPVAAFSSADNNGEVLQLPSVPAGGATSVSGTLTFGIGTDNDNAIPGGANVYELDAYGNFNSLVYNGITYTSTNSYGSFLDSGSNSLFVSDPSTLSSATGVSITNCSDNGYYCVASPGTINMDITVSGSNNVTSPTETLSIENADTLLNSTNAVLNDLGANSGGTGTSTDSFDLGMPYFLGRTIFIGFTGSSTTYPNGYWAF
ncbi:MAG TPA: DUF3443 family protein [Verrucomicrobiae bacterium]|nr:DUF3443 family protein [Verrucomicrobiae bacterium]